MLNTIYPAFCKSSLFNLFYTSLSLKRTLTLAKDAQIFQLLLKHKIELKKLFNNYYLISSCLELNKRRVCSNISISLLTLKYIALTQVSSSELGIHGPKDYGTISIQKVNSTMTRHNDIHPNDKKQDPKLSRVYLGLFDAL